MPEVYGDFQEEMDLLNAAFCDVMMEGFKGRVFTFPIPTINVTRDFNWDSPVIEKFMEITCKYGCLIFKLYQFGSFTEDAMSMCCRLRLTPRSSEKRRRTVRLQPSDRVNRCRNNKPSADCIPFQNGIEFKTRLWQQINIAKNSLEIKEK